MTPSEMFFAFVVLPATCFVWYWVGVNDGIRKSEEAQVKYDKWKNG